MSWHVSPRRIGSTGSAFGMGLSSGAGRPVPRRHRPSNWRDARSTRSLESRSRGGDVGVMTRRFRPLPRRFHRCHYRARLLAGRSQWLSGGRARSRSVFWLADFCSWPRRARTTGPTHCARPVALLLSAAHRLPFVLCDPGIIEIRWPSSFPISAAFKYNIDQVEEGRGGRDP